MKPEIIMMLEAVRYLSYKLQGWFSGDAKRLKAMADAQARIDARKAQKPSYDVWQGTSADFDVSTRA